MWVPRRRTDRRPRDRGRQFRSTLRRRPSYRGRELAGGGVGIGVGECGDLAAECVLRDRDCRPGAVMAASATSTVLLTVRVLSPWLVMTTLTVSAVGRVGVGAVDFEAAGAV